MAAFSEKPASLMSERFTSNNVALSHYPPISGRTSPASSDLGKRSISTVTFRYDVDAPEVGDDISSTTCLGRSEGRPGHLNPNISITMSRTCQAAH
ncbi:hypothetical protein ABVK25_009917 [Lepraria finkii]|uniref:Uncharacterized protein n=1 Tax=Lepraria finkii TaxID=1340010 RepID=A0ABR4AVX7_9LECA